MDWVLATPGKLYKLTFNAHLKASIRPFSSFIKSTIAGKNTIQQYILAEAF